MTSPNIATANRQLFHHYAGIIAAAMKDDSPDIHANDRYLALENLAWICETGARDASQLPEDKTSRWLGFVQGCLAMRGLIDVERERNRTRPIFHAAYLAEGRTPPPESRARPET